MEFTLHNVTRTSQAYHLAVAAPFVTDAKPDGRLQPGQQMHIIVRISDVSDVPACHARCVS